MITLEEVKHIAKLARIDFSEKELKGLQKDLSSILGYFDKLKEVDIENTLPATHSIALENINREDESRPVDLKETDKLLGAAPHKKGRFIKVKPIF